MRHAVCLFSGGKDSVFAAWWALSQGFEVSLLTMESEEYSHMFHHPNVRWTRLQAQAAGLPHSITKTSGESELADMEKVISSMGAEAIVAGAVASDYQRQRIEQIGENLGIPTYSPLWHKEDVLMKEMLEYFEIYTIAVSAEGLGPESLAKPFSELVKKAPTSIHPFLEGGEGETFVANAPFFQKRIIIDGWDVKWDGVRGIAEITGAHLS
ncbi:7-cyano-7-deazaguanine synthase [uncultured archaeon]|nr:7-cyano-7-deazaguanine synthase [uncultured archaeon]